VPWPEIIVRLFKARYDLEWAQFVAKAQAKKHFDAVVMEVTGRFNCTRDELLSAQWYREYYLEWVRQNDLPRPPRQE
jgi:hypothetical protein